MKRITKARRALLRSGRSGRSGVVHLHRHAGGEIPVGTLLVIGAIVIPLVIGLIVFRVEIFTFLVDQYVEVQKASHQQESTFGR